jgi:hypothetical protein
MFKWSELHQKQFDITKPVLMMAPVLATWTLDADFILYIELSEYVIGAVLA